MHIIHNHFLGIKYDFLDSGSYIMDGIISLHDHILYYEIIVLVLIFWVFFILFNYTAPFSLKDLTHGSILEIIWTIIPAIILILIALPSFRLLYLMDDILLPNLSVKIIGFFSGQKLILPLENNDLYWILNSFLIPNIRAKNRIGPHNIDILSVIFGSLLGNAYANKRSIDGIRICYRQSIIHEKYLNWLYLFFLEKGYVSNLKPRKYKRIIKEKTYFGYEFNTFTFKSFNWIHNSFYLKGIKILPKFIILNIYLTPLALAVWIMNDGTFVKSGVRISTYNFTFQEHENLVYFFKIKYNIDCTIQKLDNRYCLYIKVNSLNNLQNLVKSYIIPSMQYKIGLKEE
jgi:hypothetical protein